MARKRKSQTTKMSRLQRYLFSGAAVGLYFGLFFTPVREPNFTQPFLLGAAAAVIAGAVIWVRSKLSLKAGLFNLGRMFVRSRCSCWRWSCATPSTRTAAARRPLPSCWR